MSERCSALVNVYVSIGSNIAPEKNLRMACRQLSAFYGELQMSSVYQNPAVGFDGDDFLNMVVGFASNDGPEAVCQKLEQLHVEAGRVRFADPFSSRTLDVDMLLFGDRVSDQPQLPHADIEKYDYVLGPLAELAPTVRHPLKGSTMQALWHEFDKREKGMMKVDIGLN